MQTPTATPSRTPSRSLSASSPAACDASLDVLRTPHAAHTLATPSPLFVRSGFPSINEAVQLWGPTEDTRVLNAFFDTYGSERSWGIDLKTACAVVAVADGSATGTVESSHMLSIACCQACLVWDVAASGVPTRLREFVEDASVHKCCIDAKALTRTLSVSLGLMVGGLLDLCTLHARVHPDQQQVLSCCVFLMDLFFMHVVCALCSTALRCAAGLLNASLDRLIHRCIVMCIASACRAIRA
jgi:hypothetical protein